MCLKVKKWNWSTFQVKTGENMFIVQRKLRTISFACLGLFLPVGSEWSRWFKRKGILRIKDREEGCLWEWCLQNVAAK